MPIYAALIVVAVLAGCAEVVQGPRQVAYGDSGFYIRHSPLTAAAAVDKQAQDTCQQAGRNAAVKREEQYYFFDLRDVTYSCQ